MVSRDRSALMHTYAEPPVTFVRGAGSELWDSNGKRYLDFLSGLAVTGLGHAHPAVAEALAEQSRTLLHVSNLFGNVVGPEVAVNSRPSRGRRGESRRRTGLLHQLGGRGQRMCPEAGSQVGRAGPTRGREHVGRLSRPDAGDVACHRPAREARPVRAPARGLRARRLRRSRRAGGGLRPARVSRRCSSSRSRASPE